MQATSGSNQLNVSLNPNNEYPENCAVTSTTHNARIVSSIKNPEAAITLAYPGVMIIYDIHQRVLHNNEEAVTYIPNVLHLEPKISYSLPKMGYNYPFALIECLKPSPELAYPYSVEKITFNHPKLIIKVLAAVEDRFVVAHPKAILKISDDCSYYSLRATDCAKGLIKYTFPTEFSKRRPLVWKLQPGHHYTIDNSFEINQLFFHIVTIHGNYNPAKL